MFREIGPEPSVPDGQSGGGELALRYEDVTQDGRYRIEAVTHAIGAAIWRQAIVSHPLVPRLAADGIVPILSRVVVEAGGGPVGVRGTARCRGTFELVRTVDRGRVRWRIDMWGEATGARGRTHGPPMPGDGEPVVLGRIVARHVLTRPFAEPDRRTVTEIPGGAGDTPFRDERAAPTSDAMALPEGAEPLEPELVADPSPIVLGIDHTDSNQHVNSLVYPRHLEESALRRFDALGLGTKLFARTADVGFRKPSFAGGKLFVTLRAFRLGQELGVVGAFLPSPGAPLETAHAYARMLLVP
jgi:hypothetical protein